MQIAAFLVISFKTNRALLVRSELGDSCVQVKNIVEMVNGSYICYSDSNDPHVMMERKFPSSERH